MKRGLAPTAILMPISRVRSSTTTFMMFETPMPPTISVNEPMMPRKTRKVRKKMRRNFSSSVVSQMPMASLSFGSNLQPPAEHLVDPARDVRDQPRVLRLEDEVVDVALAEERPEGRVGDEGLVLVAPAVARVLGLLLHDADDEEGHVVDHDRLADRVVLAEEVLLSLSPRKTTRRRRSTSRSLT